MKRAGFWIRLSVAAIDVVIVVAAIFIASAGAETFGISLAFAERDSECILYGTALVYSISEFLFAMTLGKLIFGLRISQPDGTPADHWRLLLRWCTKWLPFIFGLSFALSNWPAFYFLGGLMNLVILIGLLPLLGESKRAWHDEWSGTAVYKKMRSLARNAPSQLEVRS